MKATASPNAGRAGLPIFCLFTLAFAISGNAQPTSRQEEVQQGRQKKMGQLVPETEGKWIERLNRLEDNGGIEAILTGEGLNGWQPILFGGTRSGNGTAFGTGYLRRDLAYGKLRWQTTARGTRQLAYLLDTRLSSPRFSGGKIGFDLLMRHENSPMTDYYGPGSDSDKNNRTSYRLETTDLIFTIESRAVCAQVAGAGPMSRGVQRKRSADPPRRERSLTKKGTLVVDLWDAATKQKIWRGTSTVTISVMPEKNSKKIHRAVEKLFAKYPPK